MKPNDKIERLEAFKQLVLLWESSYDDSHGAEIRSAINREKGWVRQEVIAADCFKTLTISPPPAVGGLVINRVDAFAMLFEAPYGMSLTSIVVDMIDETIGVLSSQPEEEEPTPDPPLVREETVQGFAFIVMPMVAGRPELDDVLDSIKEAGARCGLQAERVDEVHSTDRITDRILESIRRAEYVIADLTEARPNVYFEAGYAHALGKIPIYVARAGTQLEFDLKDYPVTFFASMRELKDALETKLRAIARERAASTATISGLTAPTRR